MKNKLMIFALCAPLFFAATALTGCHAWIHVDGFDARYVDRPAFEGHPRWRYNNYVVYEVNGGYYREHEGRWIVYRERPVGLVAY